MPDSAPVALSGTPPLDLSPIHSSSSHSHGYNSSVQSETAQSDARPTPSTFMTGTPNPHYSYPGSSLDTVSPLPHTTLEPPKTTDSYTLPSLSLSMKTLERAIAAEELRVVVDVVKNDRSTVTAWYTFFSLTANENLASFRKRFDDAVLNKTLQRQNVTDYNFYCEMKSRSGDIFPIDGDLQWTAVKPKLALHPDRYRLYVHVTQNQPIEGKRETRVSIIPTTDEQALDALMQETVFLFSSAGVSECKNLFYVPNPVSSGCLYYCSTDRKVQYFSCRLPLDEITSFYLTGASSMDYKHNTPSADVPEKEKRSMTLLSDIFGGEDTLVIITPDQQWKLQMSSGLCTWVAGLHYAIVSSGATITNERQRDRLNFNVERSSTALTVQSPEDVEDMMKMASRPTFYDYYRDMAQGRNFAIFSLDAHGEVRKDDIFLFFDDQEPVPFQSMGALYWCEPGRRVAFSSHCMPIRNIKEIYTGKRTQIFECKAGAPSRKECCLTLISDRERLDLEAESPKVVHNWVRAINTLKQKSGIKVCTDEVVPRENNVPTSRQFDTIMPKNLPVDFSMFNAQERIKMKEVNRLLQLAEEPVKDITELKSDITVLRERLVVLEMKLAHAQVEKEMRRSAHKQRTREKRSIPSHQSQPRAVFNPRPDATVDDDVAALQRMEQLLDSLEADGEPDDGNFSPEPYVPTPSNPVGRLHYVSPSQSSGFRTPNELLNPATVHVSPLAPLHSLPGTSSDSAGEDPSPMSHYYIGKYAKGMEARANHLHSDVRAFGSDATPSVSNAFRSTPSNINSTFSPMPLVSPLPFGAGTDPEEEVVEDVRKTRARVEKKVQEQRNKRSLLHSHRAVNSASD